MTLTPNKINDDPVTYDNGDKAGSVVGYLSSTAVLDKCSATDVDITAYRDVGGIVGMVNKNATATNNTAKEISITIDQVTNSYGSKTPNAGESAGRVNGTNTTVENNTFDTVTIK